MNTNGQNKTEEELLEELKTKMPLSEILGKYKESPTIKKLKELNERKEFVTESLYLNLEYGKPYIPAPIDIIPFGYTGGDGCYFAFLTEFELYENLDECPIVFISPTDFNDKEPQHANKILARNIFDFLTVLTQLRNPEITRFKDLKTMDFESHIRQVVKDHIHDSLGHIIDLQNSTIELLKTNFNLPIIPNLNQYYIDIERERNELNYLKLKDNLNLKLDPTAYTEINRLDSILNPNELEIWLIKNEKNSRLAFYREAPYIYEYFRDEFKNILEIIVNHMEKDGLIRESNILRFEIKQKLISDRWLELRKQKLKNES